MKNLKKFWKIGRKEFNTQYFDISKDGDLVIFEGNYQYNVRELAEKFGTPLKVMLPYVIEQRVEDLMDLFDDVIRELQGMKNSKKLFFFVDDNFAGDMDAGKLLMQQLENLNLPWITQLSINAAHDEDFLHRLARSGCRGVLIGFESLDEANLRVMNKRFNTMRSGYAGALDNLRRHGIAVYGTFIFGYEHDHQGSFAEALDFAREHDMYIAAFNHLTPFPGTPLYQRLQAEGRLRYEAWWLDSHYRYNEIPFVPKNLSPEEITQGCVEARRRFYAWPSIMKRSVRNRSNFLMWRNFFPINALHRNEIAQRNAHPLGDEIGPASLLEVA